MFNGVVPRLQETLAERDQAVETVSEPALIQPAEDAAPAKKRPEFDFFTVLPEMEVVVPEQELAQSERSGSTSREGEPAAAYILQAGSFRSMSDADQMKARLALLGTQANIEVVTVNDVRWHRVRIGPIAGAREADEVRRLLLDNDIETMILKDSS